MTTPEETPFTDPSVEELTRLNKELFGEQVVVIDDTAPQRPDQTSTPATEAA